MTVPLLYLKKRHPHRRGRAGLLSQRRQDVSGRERWTQNNKALHSNVQADQEQPPASGRSRVQPDLHIVFRCIANLGGTCEKIARDHGPVNGLSQRDVLLPLKKLASLYQQAAGECLDRSMFSLFAPLHEGAAVEAHSAASPDLRNLLAWPPESAVADAKHAAVACENLDHRRVFPMKRGELPVHDQKTIRRTLLDKDGTIATIRTDTHIVTVASSRRGRHKFVTDVVAKTECVEHVLPVRTAKDKCLPILHLPIVGFPARAPPRIEVHILDPANIVDRIDPDAASQRLACYVANVVALILACIDTEIWIEQLNILHGRIFSTHRNRPRIRCGYAPCILLRVEDTKAVHRTVAVQREKRFPILFLPPTRHEEGCAILARLRLPLVPYTRVRRHAKIGTAERDTLRHIERTAKEVPSRRVIDRATNCPMTRVHRSLEPGRIICTPIPSSTEAHDTLHLWNQGRIALTLGCLRDTRHTQKVHQSSSAAKRKQSSA